MKLSIQMTMVVSAVFALLCLGVAVNGFMSIGDIADPQVRADAVGFAWFWAALGGIGAAFALLAWWLTRERPERA